MWRKLGEMSDIFLNLERLTVGVNATAPENLRALSQAKQRSDHGSNTMMSTHAGHAHMRPHSEMREIAARVAL
jgi:hypothetical protein